MSVELPATLISRTGIAQVNWTMSMSSRGWQALHGLAEQPATLSTGIPTGRRCAHRATPAPGKAVTQDRKIACLPLALLPFCSPDGPFRCYSHRPGPAAQG
jgi:hypothetical protein